MANYWMVRSDESIRELVEKEGFIAIGFGGAKLGNLAGLNRDEIQERVKPVNPEGSPNQIGSHTGNLSRFVNDIKIGDWVVTDVGDRQCLIGKVTSDYQYVPSDPRHPHRRPVEWHPHRVGRTDLAPFIRKVLSRRTQTVNEIPRG